MMVHQAELPFAYDALAPFMDERTLRIHYEKVLPTYLSKLNALITINPATHGLTVEQMVCHMRVMPQAMRRTLRNCGGGHLNHSLFYSILKPGGPHPMPAELQEILEHRFGSISRFREEFSASSAGRFGAGWNWLVLTYDDLYVYSTANQDHPFMPHIDSKGYPLMNLDLWEHAYFLSYDIRRPAYVQAYWQVINWEEVYRRYLHARELLQQQALLPGLSTEELECLRAQPTPFTAEDDSHELE